ncbi:DUF4240 domain-containing protein [Actinokineospora auranticolor]|uniref:Uncharacterized protein DUF4240 n=1 Tax=Actinokineospora auranticolor TaxID=155976 RepID=A0A2S6GEE9_9PSEU|nr:DUF4240 domain-containing protein [Actinokineospora auranticolor]PPK63594.1 uncharacterized protein DUF4240 [Actinokineospora auranticolor]
MTDEAFWQLIGRTAEQPGDRDERTEWLTEELTRLPVPQIIDFAQRLATVHHKADTWTMRAAARLIHDGWCSDDSFWSFQLWLLTLGRDTFERAVDDPDTLAEVESIRVLAAKPMKEWADRDWPEWESLDYAAHEAHQEATGQECGLESLDLPTAPNPQDAPWDLADPAQLQARLPHLSTLFAHSQTSLRGD